MTYDEVKQHLYNGGKIRKHDWTAYWFIKGNDIYVRYNFIDGTLDRRLKDIFNTKDLYRIMKGDNWVIVDD